MRKTLLTVTVLTALALGGCGAQDTGTSPSGSPTTSGATATGSTSEPPSTGEPTATDGSTAATVAAELTVTVDDGAGTTTRHTLTCSPAGGDHPDPQAACAALADPALLEPVPGDARCTAQYGGPQTATVTGTLGGASVNAEFNRTDGCQVSRWDKAAALLAAG